jgi:tRNA 2-selenouridine synthase
MTELTVEQFLEKAGRIPAIDVRSPGEYGHAHIPGALNLPLFSDDERAEVGTLYKNKGKTESVQRGLEIVGPKLSAFIDFALSLKNKELLVHCWRGGMRSSSMAWLLETIDIECSTLTGGYKNYRNYILNSFGDPLKIVLIGGYTGSGKTEVLHLLREYGEQVIDLEGLANHKGSAFGSIGQNPQPSSEYFENLIGSYLSAFDKRRRIWIEDESRNVGKNLIPTLFWEQMRIAPLIRLDIPFDVRLSRLMRDYGGHSPEALIASIQKIEKRLGFDKCKMAVEACFSGHIAEAAAICLQYYDKAYENLLNERASPYGRVPGEVTTPQDIANKLLEMTKTI